MQKSVSLDSIALEPVDILRLVQTLKSTLGESIFHCDAIITALVSAILQDLQRQDWAQGTKEVGWRNKYNIHLLSGVPQRAIYSEGGVFAKLVSAEIVQRRPSRSRWGKQRHQYRLGMQHFERLME